MAENPPPPQEPSDDWQAPAEKQPSGQWESAEIKPAAAQARAASNWLQPVIDALRVPFGALWDDPRSRPLILVSLLAVVGVCALACFILSVVLLTNPPLPGPLNPTAATQATRPLTVALVINVNNTPIPPSVPVRLTIGNTPYDVTAAQVDAKGELLYDRNAQKTAYWLAGTLVNYVVGLPDTQANRATFDGLQPDDLLVLDTANGTLRFRVSMTETVKPDNAAAFRAQTQPQLTLFLLGQGGDQRRLVIARYTDEGTPNSLTPIGSAINLGDVRVTALNSRVLPGASVGLPADRNYFQVNLRVTSLVTRVLDASQFTSALIDTAGNRYTLNSPGSFASGGAGWTHGALEPGATITGTAGFEVPAGMPGPRVEWDFTTESDNPYVARVTIPYQAIAVQATVAPTAAPLAEVSLLNVNISPQGNELRIVGTARNLTDKFLPVSLRDVQLSSSGNLIALNSSLPAFPWNITPGESLAFQLTFARPPGGQPAIFTLFGQSFEITGL